MLKRRFEAALSQWRAATDSDALDAITQRVTGSYPTASGSTSAAGERLHLFRRYLKNSCSETAETLLILSLRTLQLLQRNVADTLETNL